MFLSLLFSMRVLALLLVFTFFISMRTHAMDAYQVCDQSSRVCYKIATNAVLMGGMGVTFYVGALSGACCGASAFCLARQAFLVTFCLMITLYERILLF